VSDLSIEDVIFANLISNDAYVRATLPYIKKEYFSRTEEGIIFELIHEYFSNYDASPPREALLIDLEKIQLNEGLYSSTSKMIEHFCSTKVEADYEWLLDQTEKYCQDKAIYNAIMESIGIIDGKSDKDKGALPELLSEALGVSFDTNIGHDFLEEGDARFEFYHRTIERIPFDIDMFNKITKGGVPRKTLNVILAGTAVGKSLMMCHFAASNLMAGKNVLYITLEMAEERISERIDANLMGVRLDDLETFPKESYDTKLERIRKKTSGKLIVKEYPTATVGSGHFRHLLNELKLKKKFVPDIIYIDYLNLCTSSRIKGGANVNSYTLVKSIAEELRGLAVEFNLPIFTATQTNREGFSSSDVDLTNTSESFGLPATADFMYAAISSEELESLDQILIKQLKNRYASVADYRRFVVGIDRSRMRLYDCEQNAQENVMKDTGPIMDNTSFGQGLKAEKTPNLSNAFDGWK